MRRAVLGVVVRSTLVVPALAAPGGARPPGGAGKVRAGLRVSIGAAETYAAGQPVTVKLTVENTTKATIDMVQNLDRFEVNVYWAAPSAEGCNHRYTAHFE